MYIRETFRSSCKRDHILHGDSLFFELPFPLRFLHTEHTDHRHHQHDHKHTDRRQHRRQNTALSRALKLTPVAVIPPVLSHWTPTHTHARTHTHTHTHTKDQKTTYVSEEQTLNSSCIQIIQCHLTNPGEKIHFISAHLVHFHNVLKVLCFLAGILYLIN